MEDHSQPLVAVSVLDMGIDRVKSDLMKYAGDAMQGIPGTRDLSLVHPLPGSFLREVVLRPLKIGEMAAIASMPNGEAGVLLAFRWAVVEVRNAYGRGQSIRPTRMQRLPDGTDQRMWDEADIEEVGRLFGWEFIVEMGSLAVERAKQGKAWSGSVNYMLPPLCTLALKRIADQLAARVREIERLERSEKSASGSSPSPDAETPTSPPSDEATAAPAKGGTESEGGDPPPRPTPS